MTRVGVKLQEPHEPNISRIIFTAEQLQNRVAELGEEISAVYGSTDDLVVLGLLKGSFVFMSDLIREIKVPLHLDFLVVSSYGKNRISTDDVRVLYEPELSVKGRAVLLKDEQKIRALFTDEVLAFFAGQDNVYVEGFSSHLCFYRASTLIEPEDIPAFMKEGFEVFRLFASSPPS